MTAEQLQRFRATGALSIEADQRAEFVEGRFRAGRIDDAQTLAVMQTTYARTGMLLDPHTAVGVGVAERLAGQLSNTLVTMGTAHPAKFPDAVEQATGVRPPLPAHLADLFERSERFDVLPNDLGAVQQYVSTTFS
jgi:threonine synthase